MRVTILIILSLITVSCSTHPVNPGYERNIPTNHIFMPEYTVNNPDYVPVTFSRDAGVIGSACSSSVYINGDLAFELDSSQSLTIYMPTGNHFFNVSMKGGVCGGEVKSDSVTIESGKPIGYRISMTMGAVLDLSRTQ